MPARGSRGRCRCKALISCLALVLAAYFAAAGGGWAAEGDEAGVLFTGRYRLRLQSAALLGDSEQFYLDTGVIPGTSLVQHLAMAGFGPLNGGWYFEGNYDDTLPVPERLELRIRRAGNELFAGSRRFAAGGAGLLSWGRLLTGLQGAVLAGDKGELRLTGAVGQPLGVPVREEFSGRGLVGPYLLDQLHLPVVAGSEEVRVDDRLLQRGSDYDIDYELGAITFREPVLETSHIQVEYEYVAPQPRRSGMGALQWRSGPFALNLLTGFEREIGESDNPLEFVPPDGMGAEELPSDQEMHGAALTWELAPGAHLSSSWLATTSDIVGETKSGVAWQAGGEWEGGWGRAGFDYRVIPKEFRPLGRAAGDTDYRLFTGGYEHPFGAWHSKLNVLWRQSPLGAAQEDVRESRHLAEHVLSYGTERGTVGWSVGIKGESEGADERQVVTSAALGSLSLGKWQLEAERHGVIARIGEVQAGETLSSSRLSAHLVHHPRLTASFQWNRDRNAFGGSIADRVTVWRALASSRSAEYMDASYTETGTEANWRLQWLQSEMVLRGFTAPSRVTYGRAEGRVPLLMPGFSGTLLLEMKGRTGYDGETSADGSAQAGLHYQRGVELHLLATERGTSATGGLFRTSRLQRSRGMEAVIPLRSNLAYRGALHTFGEVESGSATKGVQQVHGLGWSIPGWRLTADVTGGLLDQPSTGVDGDDEDDGDDPPLTGLPVGRRLSFSCERSASQGQIGVRLERDWERAAVAWRGELRGVLKLNGTELEAFYTSRERRGLGEYSIHQSGKVTAQWWLGERTLFGLSGRTDLRRSSSGEGDYRGSGLFGEWTAYF
jgi:hypothetical protein